MEELLAGGCIITPSVWGELCLAPNRFRALFQALTVAAGSRVTAIPVECMALALLNGYDVSQLGAEIYCMVTRMSLLRQALRNSGKLPRRTHPAEGSSENSPAEGVQDVVLPDGAPEVVDPACPSATFPVCSGTILCST